MAAVTTLKVNKLELINYNQHIRENSAKKKYFQKVIALQ